MKHSRNIKLVLLATVAAISTLPGCDEDKPQDGQSIFETVQQCQESGSTQCEEQFARALSNHVATGPRYMNEQACLDRGHDRCTSINNGLGTDIWLPAMVGFMVGRSLDSARPVFLQGYANPETDRERQDRQVVAGASARSGSNPVFIGSYAYPSTGGTTVFSPGSLNKGMSTGAARAGVAASSGVGGSRAASVSTSAAARGGFGGTGAGVSSGS